MKQFIILIALAGLTQVSCKKSEPLAPAPTPLDGKWRMIIVKENLSGLTTTKPVTLQGDVDIIFTSNGSTDGTFIGNTPTNDIWESQYSTGANQSMTIACLSMTKVAETPWGNEFVDNIRDSREYAFDKGGRLNIKTLNKTLTFQKL